LRPSARKVILIRLCHDVHRRRGVKRRLYRPTVFVNLL
jgi:hypothetical protein